MINYCGGLKRTFHHIKTNRDDQKEFEPAMVIVSEAKPGKSFWIPLDALWKYIEPMDNADARPSDLTDFMGIVNRAMKDQEIGRVTRGGVGQRIREQAKNDLLACAFASILWDRAKILTCTGYNIAKLMQMFDIEPRPEAAAQIILFIQDGLDELKNMPELPPEKELSAGEVTMWEGGQKVAERELTVKETDLVLEEGEA